MESENECRRSYSEPRHPTTMLPCQGYLWGKSVCVCVQVCHMYPISIIHMKSYVYIHKCVTQSHTHTDVYMWLLSIFLFLLCILCIFMLFMQLLPGLLKNTRSSPWEREKKYLILYKGPKKRCWKWRKEVPMIFTCSSTLVKIQYTQVSMKPHRSRINSWESSLSIGCSVLGS